jgi:hypothetical protein
MGGYVATVPALPRCVSRGDTRDEVTSNIREAADLYDCIAAGDPVPTEAGLARSCLTTNEFVLEPLRQILTEAGLTVERLPTKAPPPKPPPPQYTAPGSHHNESPPA